MKQIGSRVMEQSGDNRTTQLSIQKVAIDVQCGNAASVMAATIPSSHVQDWSVCLSAHCLSAKTFLLSY